MRELASKQHRTHGFASQGGKPKLYRTWRGMIARCEYKKAVSYPWYGARGIRVCDEWRHNFAAFRSWALSHGYTENLTIDRIDNDGNYEPGNCQWLTNADNLRKANASRAHREQERIG